MGKATPENLGRKSVARLRGRHGERWSKSKCKACGEYIEPGQAIACVTMPPTVPTHTWIHVECATARGWTEGSTAPIPRKFGWKPGTPEPTVPDPTPAPDSASEPDIEPEPPAPESRSSAGLNALADYIKHTVRSEVESALEHVELPAGGCASVTVTYPDLHEKKIEGAVHSAAKDILKLVSRGKNVFLVGPTGSGKTHLAEQIAQILDLPFAHVSCTAGLSEGHLLGRLVPAGENGRMVYVSAPLVDVYEHGGLFLFDEIDFADPNTMAIVHSALTNGRMWIPNRVEAPYAFKSKDKPFVAMAAANTYGSGASRVYVGTNQLNAATLNRFAIGTITVDYDPALEEALCPDVEIRERLRTYRERVHAAKLRREISMRFMKDAYDMSRGDDGWSLERIEQALFEGWSEDEIAKVRHAVA